MSAYIVDRKHILYLVEAAMSHRITKYGPFSWYHGNPQQRGELGSTDYAHAADVANMLWRENIASVSARYPNESSDSLPGPTGGSFVIKEADFAGTCFEQFDPVQVLKACDCYHYQSCEHDDWKSSEAKAFVDSLRANAWHELQGYDAAKWGAPEPMRGAVRLSAMIG
jgi:hypothetical protein